jgi:YjbR
MLTADAARRLALELPHAVERDHHGFPSYRVGSRIFATLPDDDHLHVMLDEEGIREAAAEDPVACSEKWWGKRLACVRVSLADADPQQVAELLAQAHRRSTAGPS